MVDQSSFRICIVPPDPSWDAICSTEVEAIRSAIAPARAFIDHVGSSAVPGLHGKPVIDLLVNLIDWNDEKSVVQALSTLGYRKDDVLGELPRHFFVRQLQGASAESVHLHVVPLHSPYGRDMISFRDSLIGDAELSERYVALKRQLASDHPNDLDAYTAGKNEFVAKTLIGAAVAFSNDRLLTHQRAELNKAQQYHYLALASQLGVATVAALSVYSKENSVQLNLAIVGFILAFVWLALARKQRKHRAAGDQARRVVLLNSGLGEKFSAQHLRRVFDKFTVPITGSAPVREEAYFASRAAPGSRRLAELIEESAYWTRDLQQASADFLQAALLILGTLMVLALWIGLPVLASDATISLARVLVAILVFLLSSDLVGAFFAHREAAITIEEILQRIETTAAREFPESEVFLLMSDYNATVESAPFTLPGVFQLRSSSLTKRWRAYLENRPQR